MNNKSKILIIFGTRPEAIKLAPLILRLKREVRYDVKVCVSGQHREMLDQVLQMFNITPDFDLNVMKRVKDLPSLTSLIITEVSNVINDVTPNLVIVHGDTTTTFAAALAAYYHKIPVAHVEAGLRTGNIYAPWPEEINRRILALIAKIHFAPTKLAGEKLLLEGVPQSSINVTGNTVIDALKMALQYLRDNVELYKKLSDRYQYLEGERRVILVTGHRRENFGKGFKNICDAINLISKRCDVVIVYPVHLNPNVRDVVLETLGNNETVKLLDPVEYLDFVYLMQKAYLILTDSGGIQEEAPAMGKPVLVMRESTERPEAIEHGTAKLVGTETQDIVREVERLLDDRLEYTKMASAMSPYGNGNSADAIVSVLNKIFPDN